MVNLFLAAVATVLSLTNEYVTVDFDVRGHVSSIREVASGRELLAKTRPAVRLVLEKGGWVDSESFAVENGRLTWRLPRAGGDAVFTVKPFVGGWTFAVESLPTNGVREIDFMRLVPAPNKWIGALANLFSDDLSGVSVRGYECKTTMYADKAAGLGVSVRAKHGLMGWQAGLVAGPRKHLVGMLKTMTRVAGVPHSEAGGPWGLASETTRGSYLFTEPNAASVDDWISVARKGGFGLVHFESSWAERRGDYPVNRFLFPGGFEEMKASVAKFHAAGLKTGMHTLTGCVSPGAKWVAPKCSPDFQSTHTYTLAAPLAETDTELLVVEKPADDHDVVFTYMGHGNVLRLGTELVQFTGIRRERPYAFTGLQRGAFKTDRGGPYPAGFRADSLRQRYLAFYPNPDSPLADEVADTIYRIFKTCGFDQIYNDGAEGMGLGDPYARYVMRRKIMGRVTEDGRRPVTNEDSCGCGAGCWWFHTRIGAWDYPRFAAKPFVDLHLASTLPKCRDANLMAPQLGWWNMRAAGPMWRGLFPDEMEYFASKITAHDASMSLQGIDVTFKTLGFAADRMLTLLGWWEHARMARAFDDATREELKRPRSEWRLRQSASDGVWKLRPVTCASHRVSDARDSAWTVASEEARPAAIRVEALYAVAKQEGERVFDASSVSEMKVAVAKGVTADVSAADGDRGKAIRLSAVNGSGASRGAWAIARQSFATPYRTTSNAFRAWVKGDGSGALLNLQLCNPREYGECFDEHYVRLDFTGWRELEFLSRERDAEDFGKYVWPYGTDPYAVYRYHLQTNRISSVAIALNEVPAGRAASVEVVDFRTVPSVANELRDAVVTVGGRSYAVPFALASGEFACLEDGAWTHYSEQGEPLERRPAAERPILSTGANELRFTATGREDLSARAEVTVFGLGEERTAFRSDDDTWKRRLSYEAVEPFQHAPTRGFSSTPVLAVRPGELAKLAIEIRGVADRPEISWTARPGSRRETRRFPVSLDAGERLVCEDGLNWKKLDKNRKIVSEGRLDNPIPGFSGVTALTFATADAGTADCRVDFVKNYVVPAAKPTMKIMSYNVRHCEGMDRQLDFARTAAAISAEQPDFVGLQELDTAASRSQFVNEPKELARLTGMHVTFAKAIPYENGAYGNALLSREKPLSVLRIPLPGGEPRVLLMCEFGDCVVGTTHLAVDSEKARSDSIALIRKAVERFSGTKPVFLSGDWNSLPDSLVLKGLSDFLTVLSDRECQTYHGALVNGPDKRPLDMTRFCIDYIAVDSGHVDDIKVVDAHVVDDRVTSDHAPIIVRLTR